MKDYILTVAVYLVDQRGGQHSKSAVFCKWQRYPECPQIGWTLWDERKVIDVQMWHGSYGVAVWIEPNKPEDQEGFDYWCDLFENHNEFTRAESFDQFTPPR